LGAPLDVWIVRKLGVPGHEELAMGAISSGGVRVVDESVAGYLGIPEAVIDAVARRETEEMRRRELVFRSGRPPVEVGGRAVILVDDGLATGATMRAAVESLRRLDPARIVVAVPLASAQACAQVGAMADEIVCPATPEPFYGVGAWYRDFTQTSDDEVRALLSRAVHEAVVHAEP
jgi:predicted phosphoribosyltransferase